MQLIKTHHWKIVIVVAIILAATTFIISFFSSSEDEIIPIQLTEEHPPTIPFDDILSTITKEFTARLETSPLKSLDLLADIWESGTITTNFNYRDSATLFGGNIRGNFTLQTDANNHRYKLEAFINILIMNLELDAVINPESIAVRSPIMGSDFYGLTFSTIRDDIPHFAQQIGLDNATTEQLIETIENIGAFLNTEPQNFRNLFSPYVNFFYNLLSNTHQELQIIDELHKFSLTLTAEEITNAINNLQGLINNDAALNQLLNIFGLETPSNLMDTTITEDIQLQLTINGHNNRLTHLSVTGSDNSTLLFVDFGLSQNDTWLITSNIFDFMWEINENEEEYENRIKISTLNIPGLSSQIGIATLLNQEGEFTINYTDDWRTHTLEGNIAIEDDVLNLQLINVELGPTQQLTLNISATKGADFQDVEFINLNHWDDNVITLINFISSLLF